MPKSPKLPIMKIEAATRDTIDENHFVVKDLVSAGFSAEQSIDAVEKYGTLEAALSYLEVDDMEEEEEVGKELFSSTHKQLSREDSQPEDTFVMKWFVITHWKSRIV